MKTEILLLLMFAHPKRQAEERLPSLSWARLAFGRRTLLSLLQRAFKPDGSHDHQLITCFHPAGKVERDVCMMPKHAISIKGSFDC